MTSNRSPDKEEERKRTERPTSTSARHITVKTAKRLSDKLFSVLNRIALKQTANTKILFSILNNIGKGTISTHTQVYYDYKIIVFFSPKNVDHDELDCST